MRIGATITLTLATNEDDLYQCKIVDMDNGNWYIDYPIHTETNKTKFILAGETITLRYIIQGVLHKYKTAVASNISLDGLPVLSIIQPNEAEIEQIQRRSFVRVLKTADIVLHDEKTNQMPPFSTVTYDISGGGIAIILPPEIRVPLSEEWTLYFVLHAERLGYTYFKVHAKMLRVIEVDQVRIASLAFLTITEQDKQQIIRYCFEQQREDRQKYLL